MVLRLLGSFLEFRSSFGKKKRLPVGRGSRRLLHLILIFPSQAEQEVVAH